MPFLYHFTLNKFMQGFKQWCEFLDVLPYLLGISLLNEHAIPQQQLDAVINNSEFKSWLQSLGITEPLGNPIPGSVGVAYPTGDFIVKFTGDKNEADAAAVLKGYDSPNLAKVFDVKRVASYERHGMRTLLFAIVQEKLNTGVSKRHRMAGQAIYDYLDHKPGFLRGSIEGILPGVIDRLAPKYRQDRATLMLVRQMLEKIKKIQDDRGFLTQDTHGANIALKGREPAFFDLGRSSLDFDNPATAGARVTRL